MTLVEIKLFVYLHRFWAPQLISFATKDHNLKKHFVLAGWHKTSCDYELIRNLYLKSTIDLQSRWLHAEPIIEDHIVQQYTPENFHTDKVTAFLLYKDKLFLSLANGNIERRIRNCSITASSNYNSLQDQKTIHSLELSPNVPLDDQNNDEHHMLGR